MIGKRLYSRNILDNGCHKGIPKAIGFVGLTLKVDISGKIIKSSAWSE